MKELTVELPVRDYAAIPQTRRQTALNSTLMMLFAGDVLVLLLASLAGYYLRFKLFAEVGPSLAHYSLYIVGGSFSMAVMLYVRGMYRIDMLSRYRYGSLRVFACVFYWGLLFTFVALFFRTTPDVSRLCTLYTAVLMGVGLFVWRYWFSRMLLSGRLLQSARRSTIVVGWNDQAQQLYERSLSSEDGLGFFPFRIRSAVALDDESLTFLHTAFDAKERKPIVGGGIAALERLVESGNYDTLLLADAGLDPKEMFKIQELCGREMIDFMMIPSFVQTLTSCLHVESFQGTPLLTQTKRQLDRSSSVLTKRVFDICGAIVGLTLFVPVIAYFCFRVHRESPGPVFYRQKRLGKNGRPFEIIKIRSMRLDAEAGSGAQWCVEDDPRRLQIGEFIRKYNIDELPQFWNVLKGEMSLVGPRPERPELILNFKHDISYYNVRHTVKPGVTGWAQVSGWRGDTCLNSRIACDIEYIERWSVWFDLYICLRTFNATKNAY